MTNQMLPALTGAVRASRATCSDTPLAASPNITNSPAVAPVTTDTPQETAAVPRPRGAACGDRRSATGRGAVDRADAWTRAGLNQPVRIPDTCTAWRGGRSRTTGTPRSRRRSVRQRRCTTSQGPAARWRKSRTFGVAPTAMQNPLRYFLLALTNKFVTFPHTNLFVIWRLPQCRGRPDAAETV
jgi:hypothetical protein